jgi:hypothetical protein
MGTNYYARIIPTKERKEQIKKAIDADDFSTIRNLVAETYNGERPYSMKDVMNGEIHLGKRSGGWKFLWDPNVYVIRNGHLEDSSGGRKWVYDSNTAYYLYPLTKEGVKAFIGREDVVIYDEYGDKQDKEEFFQMALDWYKKDGYDGDSYVKAHPNERKLICSTELTDLLEQEGYKLSKFKHDFYSDGLRFSTSTDFS